MRNSRHWGVCPNQGRWRQSRAPEKPGCFFPGGQQPARSWWRYSAQGCGEGQQSEPSKLSISSWPWITVLNLCLSCSQSLAPLQGIQLLEQGALVLSLSQGTSIWSIQTFHSKMPPFLYITQRVELLGSQGLCHLGHPRNQSDLHVLCQWMH